MGTNHTYPVPTHRTNRNYLCPKNGIAQFRTMKALKTVLTNPGKILRYVWYYVFKLIGHRDYCRFIVLGRSRTGSNLLLSYLYAHPNVKTHGEVFGKLNGKDYNLVLGKIFSKQPFYIKAIGFKIFYYHPQDDPSSGVWDYLVNDTSIRVIHLKRRNILRTVTSRKIAGLQDVWFATQPNGDRQTRKKIVEFTAEELSKDFELTRAREEKGDWLFTNHRMLTVYYEDLVHQTDREFKRITEFLSLSSIQPFSTLRRQNPERLSDLIFNYDELKEEFAGSEWHHFFEPS